MSAQHRDLGRRALVGAVPRCATGQHRQQISRAARWQSTNAALPEGALHRSLELFDLTLDDPRLRQSPARLREVARAREVVADLFAGPNQYQSTAASLQKYFDAYALAARQRRA